MRLRLDVVDCKYMEFIAPGWCIVKQLRLDQTKNLTCGDLGIPLRWLDWQKKDKNRIEKDWARVPSGFVWEKEQMGVLFLLMSFSRMVSMASAISGVGLILDNWFGI